MTGGCEMLEKLYETIKKKQEEGHLVVEIWWLEEKLKEIIEEKEKEDE